MKNRIAASLAGLLFCLGSAAAQATLDVDLDAPTHTIAPEIYGQFLEHVGTQPYGGIWVGPDSDIPNTDGIRDDVFDALKALNVPVVRWPGGCFADLYHWRDGIGPRADRPARVNMVWGGTAESNEFGTHEFFEFAERLGAKTYLNLNLGTGTAKEGADWLEYLTAESGDRAEERRANGRDAPWKVDYLSIGNETWGCGGAITAGAYADLYAQFASFAKTAGDQPVRIISGAHDANPEYADTILEHPYIADLAEGISLHVYTLPTGDWGKKGAATGFPEAEWASTMKRTLRMADVIEDQKAILKKHDLPADAFGLYVDEWGMWVDQDEATDPPALYQQGSIRDAIVAGLNLNLFHAHADVVKMTNIAQMVNVLQAMILTDGPDMVLTPTYHVFDMYQPFMGAEALEMNLQLPDYVLGDVTVPAISASAARTEDGRIVLALVNASAHDDHLVDASAFGASKATGRILQGEEMDSHNTFDGPDRVQPAPYIVDGTADDLVLSIPARSVVVVTLD
ncbi:MAG TPA: alpha-N-arabinofuranosidase [Hyphomonas sp.]|uniref:alpha-N-arabinofuranosidase n=1 Tax=Hyphomonas sp. TaxID=87 RepID=UPI000E8BB7D8|nr:alpha-L-arabinofuranosidase C-terminal domain-containing protein [Hyphomonas sp.]HBN92320.1 alpha-N-arabinofuranosidase [Hyphomonas sp.]